MPTARDAPESGSTSWYFSDDEPELITSTTRPSAVMHTLRLDRGDGDGVDDVFDQRAAGQVVHRLVEALQRLIGVVAGVEVREDQHRGTAGDRRITHLGGGDRRVDRGVVLDGAVY